MLLTSVAQNCAVMLLCDLDHGPGDYRACQTGSEQVFSVLVDQSISNRIEYLTSVLIDCIACISQVSVGMELRYVE